MLKRNFVLHMFTVVVLMTLVLAACGVNAASGKSGEVTLTIAARAGAMGDALTESAKNYQETKGIKVQVVCMPYAELKETAVLDVRNNAGAYDLVDA